MEKPFEITYQPTSQPFTVVNSVAIGGSEKYLVVRGKRSAEWMVWRRGPSPPTLTLTHIYARGIDERGGIKI